MKKIENELLEQPRYVQDFTDSRGLDRRFLSEKELVLLLWALKHTSIVLNERKATTPKEYFIQFAKKLIANLIYQESSKKNLISMNLIRYKIAKLTLREMLCFLSARGSFLASEHKAMAYMYSHANEDDFVGIAQGSYMFERQYGEYTQDPCIQEIWVRNFVNETTMLPTEFLSRAKKGEFSLGFVTNDNNFCYYTKSFSSKLLIRLPRKIDDEELKIFSPSIKATWVSKFEYFPHWLNEKKDLKTLWLEDCRFKQLPVFIKNLIKLRELRLFDNCLTELPDFLTKLPELKILYILGSQDFENIENVIHVIQNCKSLTNLTLEASIFENFSNKIQEHLPNCLIDLI